MFDLELFEGEFTCIGRVLDLEECTYVECEEFIEKFFHIHFFVGGEGRVECALMPIVMEW